MVMDATQPQQPSPQSVGREFVRQYYTLLNKSPYHLHRFYNNNSSFIHGESTLVVGQKNIHNRIQQLNFHDCHAKISQVDAQATLGNGIVVQVTGELSNDGQPMRRFTQTFVLAAQSPKKYYVHNDIFRYQDMYSDEEVDGEARSENDDDHEQQQQQISQPPQSAQVVVGSAPTSVVQGNEQPTSAVNVANEPQGLPNQVVAGANAGAGVLNQQAQTVYYPMPAAGGRPMAVLPPPPVAAPVPLAANFANASAAAGVPPPAVPTSGVAQLNGVVAHDELITNIQQPTITHQSQLSANQTPSPVLTQAAGAASVGNAAVLGAQTPAVVANVPVAVSGSAAAGLPQNAPSAIPSYQQSSLMASHILQQPQQQLQQQPQQAQQHPQQQLPNNSQLQQQQQQHILQQQSQTPLAASSTIVDVDEAISSSTMILSNSPSTVTEQQQQQQTRPNTTANVVASGQTVAPASATILEPTLTPVVEDFKTINEQQQQEKYEAAKQQQQQQNEPKTYANLFKSSSSSPSSFVNAAMQQQQQIQQQQQQQQPVNSMYHQTNSSNISSNTYSQSASSINPVPVYGSRNSENNSNRQDNNSTQSSGVSLPQRSNAKSFNKDFDQRRTSNPQQFGDSQQLFLGNIPHHASEDELKDLFSRFGQVVDLRILSKSSGKLPPGARNPLNYGFITYNDAEAVQNCLANCPLYFPDSPDGQKLNVEEKKPRTRPNDMPQRQSMGGGSGGSGMNNMNNNQRNMSGGPPSRSLSNSGSGSMMRGNSIGNNNNTMSRGGSSGGGSGCPPRMGGAFNRNDNRTSNGGNSGGGSQMRGNSTQTQGSSYGVRR